MQGWGGSWWGGVGHVGVGWVMQGQGGSCRGGVGEACRDVGVLHFFPIYIQPFMYDSKLDK